MHRVVIIVVFYEEDEDGWPIRVAFVLKVRGKRIGLFTSLAKAKSKASEVLKELCRRETRNEEQETRVYDDDDDVVDGFALPTPTYFKEVADRSYLLNSDQAWLVLSSIDKAPFEAYVFGNEKEARKFAKELPEPEPINPAPPGL